MLSYLYKYDIINILYGDYMKKIYIILIVIISCIVVYFSNLGYKHVTQPSTYYNVYLDGEIIGVINSKEKLENYIDKQNNKYKKKFRVDRVYSPNGLDIEKNVTYDGKVDDIKKVYAIIQEKRPFTISGYQFTIDNTVDKSKENTEKSEESTELEGQTGETVIKLYVVEKEIFNEAVESLYMTFAGKETYKSYKDESQTEITTVGSYLDDIYIDSDITVKNVRIPVNETIYSDYSDLAQYLLFGSDAKTSTYTVKMGDTIESVSLDNKISIEEFLLSNPTFTDESNLLFPGQQVLIGMTNPKIRVVTEESVTEDVTKKYETIIRYDSSRVKGDIEVVQNGVNGLERVSQKVKKVNGNISYVQPVSNEELKASQARIVIYGQKEIRNVGATGSWYWPTKSGYIITSNYGWRLDPFSGRRTFHNGLDISGTGYGSPVFASNNGTVVAAGYRGDYGNYVVINHNNGYSSLYGHMSRIASTTKVGVTVARGQTIGYVGSTGQSTGPHLHFEIWRGVPFTGSRLNPLKYL